MRAGVFQMSWLLLLAVGTAAQPQQAKPAATASTGYRIAGVVVNSLTGAPIAGASVGIAPTAGASDRISKTYTTAADGRFSFPGVSRGKYSLMATARGFSLQYFEHHDEFSTAIAVGPDLEAEHLIFRMDPDAAVEGQVIDENNEPVQNAMIRLFERRIQDGREKTVPSTQTQTDDVGRYRISHLSPGNFYLAVSARPWYAQNFQFNAGRGANDTEAEQRMRQDEAARNVTYPLTFYPDSPDSAGAGIIALNAGERTTADVVLRAVPALTLRIRLPLAADQDQGFQARAPRLSQRIFEGYLDPASNALFSSSQPGLTEVSGVAPGHYVVEMSGIYGPSGKGRSWYHEIDLTGDAELNATETSAFASVSGTVFFENAATVPRDSFLLISNPATGESFRSPISDKGQFDFTADSVKPGRYNVLLENAHGFFLKKISATGARMAGRTLEITGASSVNLKCTASRGIAQVIGTALRDGQPFAGAMIVLAPQDLANNVALVRRDQSDSDGTFTLPNVVPGRYTVLAIANGWDLEWGNPAALQPYLEGGEPIEITGDGKAEVKVQVH